MTKHKCAHDMHFDDSRGRCVQDETVNGAEDPNSRSKASSPLTFPTHKKRGDIQECISRKSSIYKSNGFRNRRETQ